MSNNLPIATDLRDSQGLSAFLRAANSAPVLSAEEERTLARRYREHDDLEAARQLVISNLRHVVYTARGFLGYGLPLADLIQEGNIGLMKAVKRYDPDRDVRLVSFAVHWIRAEIYDFVVRNWRIVRVATTKAQRKLFFNLRKSRSRLGWLNENEVGDLASNLDVPKDVVREMEGRLTSRDVAFNDTPKDDDPEHYRASPENYLADHRYDPARTVSESSHTELRDHLLRKSLKALDKRSRDIITRRWLREDDKTTLQELADKYGVSAERIRQIEKQAMEQMKEGLGALAPA